jgi:hypothetical protein
MGRFKILQVVEKFGGMPENSTDFGNLRRSGAKFGRPREKSVARWRIRRGTIILHEAL